MYRHTVKWLWRWFVALNLSVHSPPCSTGRISLTEYLRASLTCSVYFHVKTPRSWSFRIHAATYWIFSPHLEEMKRKIRGNHTSWNTFTDKRCHVAQVIGFHHLRATEGVILRGNMENWEACGCVVVGSKVAAWLYAIQSFAQCDCIFSLTALDQHLAVSSSLIRSTQT